MFNPLSITHEGKNARDFAEALLNKVIRPAISVIDVEMSAKLAAVHLARAYGGPSLLFIVTVIDQITALAAERRAADLAAAIKQDEADFRARQLDILAGQNEKYAANYPDDPRDVAACERDGAAL